MIPHLSRYHGKCEYKCQNAPHLFVEQKVQIIASQIEKTTNQTAEHENGNGTRIIWWTEYTDLDVGTFLNPFGNGFGRETNTLDVHCVWTWKMRNVNLNTNIAGNMYRKVPFGLPLAGKCINTGAVFKRNNWKMSEPSSKSTMAKNKLFE